MITYLTGFRTPHLDNAVSGGLNQDELNIGLLVQPLTKEYLRSEVARHYQSCGIDNGCFTKVGRDRYNWPEYERVIKLAKHHFGDEVHFATAEDQPFDWVGTLKKSLPVLPKIRALGVPAGLVLQNGATVANVPWGQFDSLFIGGDDKWKEGQIGDVKQIVDKAKKEGIQVHMGRVNTMRRMRIADALNVDSADGTFLMHESRNRHAHMIRHHMPEEFDEEFRKSLEWLLQKPEHENKQPGSREYNDLLSQARWMAKDRIMKRDRSPHIQQTAQDSMYAAMQSMFDWFRHLRRDRRKNAMRGIPASQVDDYELAGHIPLRDPDFDFDDNEDPYAAKVTPYWGRPKFD